MTAPKITVFLFVLSGFAAFGQGTPANAFIGLHYTGLSYDAARNDARAWNSGFGAMVGVRPGKRFSLELACELNPVRETVRYADDHHTLYRSAAQLYALHFGWGWVGEKYDARFLLGPGFSYTGKIDRTDLYTSLPAKEWPAAEGRLRPALNAGFRGMYHIGERFSASLAAYGNVRFRLDKVYPSHFGNNELYPLDSFILIYLNAGIAYRFNV